MNKQTFYQKTRLGKYQQWTIWVDKRGKSGHPEVWIEHGLESGKKQLTFDIISEGVNVGKANETTPLEQATLTMERKITKQKEMGYREDKNSLERNLTIDFSKHIPKELCFYKPKNSIDDKKIKSLSNSNQAVYTVKRDGMMHVVRKTEEFGVEIYSRRMDLVTENYPHLQALFDKLPNNTILLGEIIFIKEDGTDDFNIVSRICRSDPDKAIELQAEFGKVSYYIFDVAFWNGENLLTSKGYSERRNIILRHINGKNISYGQNVMVAEVIQKSHKNALKEVKDRGLEGLVVWDSNGVMTDNQAFTLNGKAYRPSLLWKSKPKFEDDFIVRFNAKNGIGEYGTGKNNGKVKSVCLYQIDENGKEVFISKCGGGLSDKQRDFYTMAEYPRVWKVEYDSIQPETGSLRFPVFNADRTLIGDKLVNECLISDQIRKARKGECSE